MAILNERNEHTKGVIHLLITEKCNRNCKYCCNKQYDLSATPVVTAEEFSEAHTIFLTGGEPFAYSQPNRIAKLLKIVYPNIQHVYVYTNAVEFYDWYLLHSNDDWYFDGLDISIKNKCDSLCFQKMVNSEIIKQKTKGNRVYVFDEQYDGENNETFTFYRREWQTEFTPSDDSIFRRF